MAIKRYLITSAQACYYQNKEGDQLPYGVNKNRRWTPKAEPNYNFLKGLETCSKETGAELIIQPVAGKNTTEDILHESLEERQDIFRGKCRILNKNLQIRDIVVPPQNVDPTTGKEELIGEYNSSFIFAHPKQRWLPVPTFNVKLPRYIYTPGSVTEPNFNTANHRGDTAERMHTYGALLVEVLDNTYYNITNLRAMKNGKFVDRRKLYDGDNPPKKVDVVFMVLGDFHLGNEDGKAMEITHQMIKKFCPRKIFVHDCFDGYSINHHEKENSLMRAREFGKGRLSLEDELRLNYKEIIHLSKIAGNKTEIYIVSSNHHRFLPKYINSEKWMEELWNVEIGSYLHHKGISLTIPENEIDDASYLLEEGMKRFGRIPDRVKFLRLKDDFRMHGYQLAIHGDKGKNGARGGGAKSRGILGGGKSVSAHSHAAEIRNRTYIVGTNSLLDLPYTAGSGSASIAANIICFENGLIQMLPIIEGKWMNFGL